MCKVEKSEETPMSINYFIDINHRLLLKKLFVLKKKRLEGLGLYRFVLTLIILYQLNLRNIINTDRHTMDLIFFVNNHKSCVVRRVWTTAVGLIDCHT